MTKTTPKGEEVELPAVVYQTVTQRIAADKREARKWLREKRQRGSKHSK